MKNNIYKQRKTKIKLIIKKDIQIWYLLQNRNMNVINHPVG
jgi:hypothetical protein